MTAHANCDHDITPAARAVCRKARHAAVVAHAARQKNVLDQLYRPFGSGNLLHRVCYRYENADRSGDSHVNHVSKEDCADAILRAIDYWRNSGDININENDLKHHAYRMFS